jgi:hypothetical protein
MLQAAAILCFKAQKNGRQLLCLRLPHETFDLVINHNVAGSATLKHNLAARALFHSDHALAHRKRNRRPPPLDARPSQFPITLPFG